MSRPYYARLAPAGSISLLRSTRIATPDQPLLLTALVLLAVGLVMIGSASMGIATRHWGEPLHFLMRQFTFASGGLLIGYLVWRIPVIWWQKSSAICLVATFLLLAVLLIPGVGHTVNGSTRWLRFGGFSLQVSELAKLAVVIYVAGYLVRHGEVVRTTVSGFITPMVVAGISVLLLIAEPDFGAAAVIMVTVCGMLFIGGVRWWIFGLMVSLLIGAMALLAVTSPYRMERLTAFLNPWADPFNSGFQLTQALIAFGRGEWFGVGLGGSVQKLFYLPEAHTDFVFAVMAEELGLFGAVVITLLYTFLVWRIRCVGVAAALAGHAFGAYTAFGIGIWLALQSFINMGVNMGLLPTKGLTLPLMSYGGSSIVVTCIALGLVLRIGYEAQRSPHLGRGYG